MNRGGPGQDEDSYLTICRKYLVDIPSWFGRLAWLAKHRDPLSGRYRHPEYEPPYGAQEVERVLRLSHQAIFERWLAYRLEKQLRDVARYLSSPIRDGHEVSTAGTPPIVTPLHEFAPGHAVGPDATVFLAGITIVFFILDAESRSDPDSIRAVRHIRGILRFLEENAAPWTMTLDTVSREVHLSGEYCRHIFRRAAGITFRAFLRYSRFKKAAYLLRTTFHSIEQVATELHYEHASNFSRDFRASLGLSPAEYRAARRTLDVPTADIETMIDEMNRE